ncbi:hypothetical protein POTOM_047920 [Populus tomentosa]|uniref:Uncharacterized protein n=1 Tax=Populus tomentosa TaxID=118781 RepID=A0A8X8CBA1_POPTO|nr:hypothetical protein POTOM_047920 [Populus tomentosa]
MSSCCFPVKLERSFKNYSSKKLDKSPTKDNYCFQSLLVPNSIGIPETCKSAHLAAMDIAKNAGCLLSYDPDLRLLQWPSEEAARKDFMTHGMKLALLRELSTPILSFYLPLKAQTAADTILRNNQLTSLRNVKQEFKGKVSGFKVGAANTTGLVMPSEYLGLKRDVQLNLETWCLGSNLRLTGSNQYLSRCRQKTDSGRDEKKLKEPLLFANACGAISVYRRGAIPAVPQQDAVLKVTRPGALLEKIHTSNGNATHVSMVHIIINPCHYLVRGRMILVR